MSLLGYGLNMDRTWHMPGTTCFSFTHSDFPAVSRSLSKVEEGQRNRMCTLKKCRQQDKGFCLCGAGE